MTHPVFFVCGQITWPRNLCPTTESASKQKLQSAICDSCRHTQTHEDLRVMSSQPPSRASPICRPSAPPWIIRLSMENPRMITMGYPWISRDYSGASILGAGGRHIGPSPTKKLTRFPCTSGLCDKCACARLSNMVQSNRTVM